MTIPVERTRAVLAAREFLQDLLVPSMTKNVPPEIRNRARRILRHYPGYLDIFQTVKDCPSLWSIEP